MQISLRWLNDYINVSGLSVDQVCETLTNLGLEVEGVQQQSPWEGDVVIGRIEKAEPHPNADKLQVCQVNIGRDDPLRVVCGAPNARKGLYVAVATVGSVLPGEFRIKAAKVRGEMSEGMLCSEKELGISSADAGILELPDGVRLGQSIMDYFNLGDTIIEIGLTPNRSDCLGYIGIARDLAAKLKIQLKNPDFNLESIASESFSTEGNVHITLEPDGECGRFSAIYIKQVSPRPSPLWMQARLANSGMRPLNLIVDVTNYVMLEFGHPIHAYDERDVAENHIKVRSARSAEQLTTLDGMTRQLTPEDIVICDAKQTIGLAGIMGGENSEIKDDTENIIVEVAHFNPKRVRRTAKRLALHTEASHRFERGVDVQATDRVAKRVAYLLHQCTQELNQLGQTLPVPQIAKDVLDVFPAVAPPARVALRLSRARHLLGLPLLAMDECISILESLGMGFLDKTDDRMLFEIPSWRHDVEREADLIEEIGRLRGLDEIPYKLPMMEIEPNYEDYFIDFQENCKAAMALQGYCEIISFPFVSGEDFAHFQLALDHPWRSAVHLANPLVEEQDKIQTSLLYNLVKAVAANRRQGDQGCRLFESGRIFIEPRINGRIKSFPTLQHLAVQGCHIQGRARDDDRPIERNMIAGIIDQPFQDKSWHADEQKTSFFHGKAAVLSWLQTMGITDVTFKPPVANEMPWLQPHASAVMECAGYIIGYVGELHPKTTAAYDLDFINCPVVFELDCELVYHAYQIERRFDTQPRRFPPATRDLAFVVDRSVTFETFKNTIERFPKKKFLSRTDLFDLYMGENVASDKKSMAFTCYFYSPDKTLTDKEVEKEIELLKSWLKDNLSAELR